jgi:hypothetical protein
VGSSGEPTGFFGKYLKKHRDMKAQVQEQVLQEEKETKQRLIEKMNEKIALKKKPEQIVFSGTGDSLPKKKHKLTLSERTGQNFAEEQEKIKSTLEQQASQSLLQTEE